MNRKMIFAVVNNFNRANKSHPLLKGIQRVQGIALNDGLSDFFTFLFFLLTAKRRVQKFPLQIVPHNTHLELLVATVTQSAHGRAFHLIHVKSTAITLFRDNFTHLHSNTIQRGHEAISGYFVIFARNCLAFAFNFIVMQM